MTKQMKINGQETMVYLVADTSCERVYWTTEEIVLKRANEEVEKLQKLGMNGVFGK